MRKLFKSLPMFLLIFTTNQAVTQTNSYNIDSTQIRHIFDEVLSNGKCHEYLRQLCKDIGHRLTASKNSYKAIEWGKLTLESLGLDKVFLQEITVPHWERGSIERLDFISKNNKIYSPKCTALGGSVGTDGAVIEGQILEIKDWSELEKLSEKDVKDKIIFYSRPMNPLFISTFHAYGDCGSYRMQGAIAASKKGAKAVIIRSLTLKVDENPHTGMMQYEDNVKKIPGMAISAIDAHNLQLLLKEDPTTKARLKLDARILPDTISYNVIGEIKGSEFPDEIILVGGHLDSWDIGEGAHDDGAGVVQSIEVLRLMKLMNYKPKRTIRCVLYMNEENGNMGGKTYAKYAKENKLNHIFALETDRGGFSPRGFSIDGTEQQVEQLKTYNELFKPYFIHLFDKGGSGVDIGPLKDGKVCLVGLVPDSQRYFDFHHAKSDVWESVHKRELELGAGAIAAMVYLVDKYGVAK
jgi:carboxypeptidase Q